MNALVKKSQTEGGYEKLRPEMTTVRGVGLIKIRPEAMAGKYKLGRFWDEKEKRQIATRMMERALKMPKRTLELWNIPGVGLLDDEAARRLARLNSIELVRMMGFENSQEYPKVALCKAQEIDW